jgi:hypothetical protein
MHDFPTGADYAQDSANEANRHADKLDVKYEDLRERVVALENLVGHLVYRLDHMQALSDRDRLSHGHERSSRAGTG